MNDKEFLIWLHARLCEKHGESEQFDYMHKLRAIIRNTEQDKLTKNLNTCNTLKDLQEEMGTNY